MKKVKAIVLFSGGLDSMLVAKMLYEQNIEVILLYIDNGFESNDRSDEFKIFAKSINSKLIIENVIDDFCSTVLINPTKGYGKAMNPCIDCHGYMINIASKIAEQEGASFIATGEVIGQRPMSQTRDAMLMVDNLSNSKVPIVRPLSAKIMDETKVETDGIIDREKFEGIAGRTRTRQIELAESLGLNNYPNPAGGCLLTEVKFANKLSNALKVTKYINSDDITVVRHGRMFQVGNALFVLGRNKEDNEALRKLNKNKYLVIEPPVERGPVAVVSGEFDLDEALVMASIMLRYCDIDQNIAHQVKFTEFIFDVLPMSEKEIEGYKLT